MLAGLVDEFRGPLSADFRRFYGCNLTDALAGRVGPLSEVAAWAAHLPPESAVRRAMDPHWQRTPEVDLLRENAYLLDVLVYVTATANGAKNLSMPERIPLPWDPSAEATT